MKITTTDFGTYTNKINRPAQQQAKPAEIQKQKLGTISNEEKKFFAGLYPESKEDVMNYHFYHKNGKMQGVTLGTFFDKRG
jgi:antitoxin component YwqK of YwqJK toxin-antitoxin module